MDICCRELADAAEHPDASRRCGLANDRPGGFNDDVLPASGDRQGVAGLATEMS